MRANITIILILAIVLVGGFFWIRSHDAFSPGGNRVLLIGIDGGDWEILSRLVNEGKLPHFKKLIQEGASGKLNSIAWRELVYGAKGYFSPIVWETITTGKSPWKHGIEDFTVPLASRLIATLETSSTTGYGRITLPDVGVALSTIRLKARAASPRQSATLDVYLNQTNFRQLKLGKDWQTLIFSVPQAAVANINNTLSFYYQVEESEVGKPVAEFNYIRLYDAYQQEIGDLHIMRDKDLYREGWKLNPPDIMTTASSFQVRTMPIWDILSAQKKRVGVIGWWSTYPATAVNGYLISSYVGHQGLIQKNAGAQWLDKLKHLTYPEEYVTELKKKVFLPESLNKEFFERFYEPGKCSCIGTKQDSLVTSFYWQDRLFEDLGIDLLKNKGKFDFFSVYFRGVDIFGHQFLQFSADPEFVKNCTGCDTSRLSSLVDDYYSYMDDAVGKLMEFNDENTITMIVTDHGQVATGGHGSHRNTGFVLLHGKAIRKHRMSYANVIDVAPTVLYMLGVPVAQDMDGGVMIEAFDPGYLKGHPIQLIGTYESMQKEEKKEQAIDQLRDQQELEDLRALGYIN